MRKKIEWQWEKLDEATQRAKVIGGWLVMRLGVTDGDKKKIEFKESMVFVADRDHEWCIAAPFNPSDPGTKHSVSTVKASDFETK